MNKPLVPTLDQLINRVNREMIGHDVFRSLLEDTGHVLNPHSYPPYNIEKLDEEHWTVTIAVAGFTEDEINITLEDKLLTIIGSARQETEGERSFIHRGIAERAFERKFILSEGVKVTTAKLQDGLLQIDFEKLIPEEKKPRRIEIQR